MNDCWYKDLNDYEGNWQGLEITVISGGFRSLEMRTGKNGRMALYINGSIQFWATMLKDHSGIWLVNNVDHPNSRLSLPPIRSSDIEKAHRESPSNTINYWSRYFARSLTEDSSMFLSSGNWILQPMEPTRPITPYEIKQNKLSKSWQFYSPKEKANVSLPWSLHSEDFSNLINPEHIYYIDWWWERDKLLSRYSVSSDSARVKWWRKKSREGTLPPILVWFVTGLASFVILDGHERLQAALLENIPPRFLVLSQLGNRVYSPNEDNRSRVLNSLAIQQQKCKNNISAIDAINNTLIKLYDTRYFFPITFTRVLLGDGSIWEDEVRNYLLHHRQEKHLKNILFRER